MIVVYAGKTWELDMPYQLFESLKVRRSSMKVEIVELSKSSYRRMASVSVSELTDYSIQRNLDVLKK